MKIVDLDILLYAVNSEASQHDRVRQWWERLVNDDAVIGLPWVVLLGFLRLATNPRVFRNPLSPDAALAKVDTWLSQDTVRIACGLQSERSGVPA